MQVDYDVIIIGAGCAGASCAKKLIEKKLKTIIIEKKELPIAKSCAGLLSGRAVEFINHNFGSIPEQMINNPSHSNLLISKRGNHFRTVKENWLSLDSRQFEKWLIRQAKVEVLEKSIYINHEESGSLIKVNIQKNNQLLSLTCRYLIGADGGYSRVRKNIDENYKIEDHLIGREAVFRIKSARIIEHHFHSIFNQKLSDYFYWLIKKGNSLKIGNSIKKSNWSIEKYQQFLEAIKSKYSIQAAKLISSNTFLIHNNRQYKFFFGKGNILLCGEAAGLLSLIGEGISYALSSGKMAAESIIENKIPFQSYLNKVTREKEIIINEKLF